MKKIGLALIIVVSSCVSNVYCADYDPDNVFGIFPKLIFGSNDSLFDEQGNVLPGNQGLGIAGVVVELILDGGDRIISPPDANGNPTGDDEHLIYTSIGTGQLALFGEVGMFAVECNYTYPDDYIYARIFNAADLAQATYYGQTELRAISDLPGSMDRYFQVDEFGLLNTCFPLDPQSDIGSQADAGGSYTGTEGSVIMLDATATGDVDSDLSDIVFTWDLDGDRQFDDATGVAVNYAWTDNYRGIIRLRATNIQTGIAGIATTQAVITNASPSIDAIADTSGFVGKQLTVTATYSDLGLNDTHTIDIIWGDTELQNGVAVTGGSIDLAHTYNTEGAYTVQLIIHDDDGASDSTSFQVEVRAVPVSIRASLSFDNGVTLNWQAQAGHHYEIWFTDDVIVPFDEIAQQWRLLDIVQTAPYADTGDIDGYDGLLDTSDDRLSPADVTRRFYTILEIAD